MSTNKMPENTATHNATDEIPRALHDGVLRMGSLEVPCCVLPDGTPVLTTNGILGVFATRKKSDLGVYIARITGDSSDFSLPPEIRFRLPTNNAIAAGYKADSLIDVCNLYVAALAAGTLHPKQVPLAARAAAVVSACAKTGITAMVWEATGYERVKAPDALRDRFADLLRSEAGTYERLFPPAFFEQLAKLYRVKLRGDGRRPFCFAAFLREFFYEWFDEDVYAELRRRNPRPSEGTKHHQFLQPVVRQRFEKHRELVYVLLEQSTSLDDFRMRFGVSTRGGPLQFPLRGLA